MRSAIKYRLSFLVIAFFSYFLGVKLTPELLQSSDEHFQLYAISGVYFVLLPLFYWFAIIIKGKQKLWKLLLIISLSSTVARFSFPEQIAEYFVFISWLKYPIVAIFVLIEFYLMITVVKGLWRARHLTGDPRIHIINNEHDDKKRTLAMVFSLEPVAWYYGLPWLSKKHPKSFTHIVSLASSRLFLFALLFAVAVIASVSYVLLLAISELLAIIVSSLVVWTMIYLIANYRVAKHFSCYTTDHELVINLGVWSCIVIPLTKITQIELLSHTQSTSKETIKLGRDKANVLLHFNHPVDYFTALGNLSEPIEQLALCVSEPERFAQITDKIDSNNQLVA